MATPRVRTMITMDPAMHAAATKAAGSEGLSLSAWLEARAAERLAVPREPTWEDALVRGRAGRLVPCAANVVAILTHHPEWRDVLGWKPPPAGNPCADGRLTLLAPPPFERAPGGGQFWGVGDSDRCLIWLQRGGLAVSSAAQVYRSACVAAQREASR